MSTDVSVGCTAFNFQAEKYEYAKQANDKKPAASFLLFGSLLP
jgi:hypothetical protein